jgi:AraC-like DNA-binding protein
LLPNAQLYEADSWEDLGAQIRDRTTSAVVLDPWVNGKMRLDAGVRLLRQKPLMPVFGYVPPTPWHLRAVFTLSRHGMNGVFVQGHAGDHTRLANAISRLGENDLAYDLLARVERGLGVVPPALFTTVRDVFERPARYDNAGDIAHAAQMPVKEVYRAFHTSDLGRPKRLIVAAKILKAYSLLREGKNDIQTVCDKLRYASRELFSDQVRSVLSVTPSALPCCDSQEEIVMAVLEWVYRPGRLAH